MDIMIIIKWIYHLDLVILLVEICKLQQIIQNIMHRIHIIIVLLCSIFVVLLCIRVYHYQHERYYNLKTSISDDNDNKIKRMKMKY